MNKNTIFSSLLLVCSASVFALPFNSTLSTAELSALKEGKVVIRNIDYTKNMSLSSDNEGAGKVKELLEDLNPNYLAEVIQVRPYKGNEDLPARLSSLLQNIGGYAGIPYWSERVQKWYDLYSSAVITSQKTEGDVTTINADLEMEPFGTIHTPITMIVKPDYIYYDSTNNNKLRYFDKFTCVKEKRMKSAIVLFRDGDNWILYGAGGVRALKVAMFEERVETSFINRIKTFCNYVFEKI